MRIIKQGYDLHLILNLENAAMTIKTSHYKHQILGECLIEYSYLITTRVGGGGGVSLTISCQIVFSLWKPDSSAKTENTHFSESGLLWQISLCAESRT